MGQQLNRISLLGVLLTLMLATALTQFVLPTYAQTDELYFQPILSPYQSCYGTGNCSWHFYMDVVRPAGSELKSFDDALFATRVLAADKTFTQFAIKLWMEPKSQENQISIWVGVVPSDQSTSAVWMLKQSFTVPTGTQYFEHALNTFAITAVTGQRLALRVLYGFVDFYWGDTARPSSLVTDHADYQGTPVPEFGSAALVTFTAVILVAVFSRSRRLCRTQSITR